MSNGTEDPGRSPGTSPESYREVSAAVRMVRRAAADESYRDGLLDAYLSSGRLATAELLLNAVGSIR